MINRAFLFPAALVAATLLAHGNSFWGVFLFDDVARIVEEKRIQRMWPIAPLLGGERPLVDLTLAINHAISGLNPWSYHGFNLVVHILAGLALYGIARRTMLFIQCSKKGNKNSDRPGDLQTRTAVLDRVKYPWESFIAFSIALIFLVHPLQTQSVTYIIQRGESMMGFLYLLTLYFAIRAFDSQRRRLWILAAIAACSLGIGTKAVMVTAPLMVAIYDWVFLGWAWRQRWSLYAGLCSTWIILWISGIAPEVMGKSNAVSHVGFAYAGLSPLQYAATQPGVIVKYIQLALWPSPLCLDYGWPIAITWQRILPPALVLVILLGLTVWFLRERQWWGYLGAWFFLILAPTSSIVPIKDVIFEHRMYLPLAAIIAAIMIPMGFALRGLPLTNQAVATSPGQVTVTISWPQGLFLVLSLALAAPLGYATYLRNRDYQNELSMWQDVVAKRPGNTRAYVAVGNALAKQNEVSQALEVTRKSTEIDPEYADGHFAIGVLLARLGQTQEAITSYQTALQLSPWHSRAWYNLGNAFDRLGQHEDAAHAYAKCTEFNPTFADAFVNWGNLLLEQGKKEEGIAKLRRAVLVNPDHAKAHYNLGYALADEEQFAEAQVQFEEAIRIQPDYHRARYNLALLHKRLGRLQEAIAQCQSILKTDPENTAATELIELIVVEMNQ